MPRNRLKLPTVSVEFSCFNCDGLIKITREPKLFCSELCQQEASLVRRVRRYTKDGRINQPDVQKELGIRISHIHRGGYKERERHIPAPIRRKIYERDKEICQKCGRPDRKIY